MVGIRTTESRYIYLGHRALQNLGVLTTIPCDNFTDDSRELSAASFNRTLTGSATLPEVRKEAWLPAHLMESQPRMPKPGVACRALYGAWVPPRALRSIAFACFFNLHLATAIGCLSPRARQADDYY